MIKYAYRIFSFVLAALVCSLCVFADDLLLVDQLPGSVGSNAELEGSDLSDRNDDNLDFDLDGSLNSLYVGELIIEGEEEAKAAAAAAEIYSISPDVQYGAYFHADISSFGDCFIYIPVAYASDSFSYNSDGLPINITQSTITGYIGGSNSDQSIQFPSFGIPRYRTDNYNQYVEISSWSDLGSSVQVYSDEDSFYSYSEIYFLRFLVLILSADLILNFLLRLLGGARS